MDVTNKVAPLTRLIVAIEKITLLSIKTINVYNCNYFVYNF